MAKKKRYQSISKKVPLMFSFSFLLLLAALVSIILWRVETDMIEDYRRMADGVTNLMLAELDPAKMDYYLKENYSSPEYMQIMKRYYQFKHNYPDIFYMYVYRFYKEADGKPAATIIIDLEDEYTDTPNQVSIDWVGGKYEVLEPFASKIDEMLSSPEPVYGTAFSQDDGYLLSFAKPILDKDGNYAATACVDFSMQELHLRNIRFIISLGVLLALVCLGILALLIYFLRNLITKPLLSISNAVFGFKYDTEDDLNDNLRTLRALEFNSNNEIGVLYDALLTAEKDSLYYMSSFKKAEDEIHTKDVKINELGNLALRDSMTSVGNKTAFTAKVSEIRDDEEYGIVLMDVNNLKKVNDTYGHEAGDEYIKGCCKVLCDTFAHSPVFRIGGDEFSVILKGRDYANQAALMKAIEATFERLWTERQSDPVHRFSGSLGMSDSTVGRTTRETIKAADDAMYASKKAFKAKYGSYR